MTQTRRRRARRVLAVAAACAALPAAPALAAPDQLSLIEDETLMLNSGPGVQAATLDEVVSLGADMIRVNVIWSRYAPSPNSTKRPRRFDGKDSNQYPAGTFAMLDSLVAGAQARGIQVLLTATGPIPAWASRCKGSVATRRTCKPNPQLFGAFVRALGRRYPTVKMWSIWNEPNLKSWLSPQYAASGERAVLQSASLYRSLAASAIAGLRGTGHRSDTILLGETAPLGSDPSVCKLERSARARRNCRNAIRQSAPETFARGVLCIDSKGKRLRGTAAREQGCSRAKRLNATGYAHHPYTRGAGWPPTARVNARDITISTLSRLTRLLDQAGRAGRIVRRAPVYLTEHGFQTEPDDVFRVTLPQQAEYINQSDWIAYNNARVRTVAQYIIADDANEVRGFQSGLRFAADFRGGIRKPSYDAYRLPIWVARSGAQATVYGQVRPAAGPVDVEVQNAAPGGSFRTVQSVPVTSANGTFTLTVPNSGGSWRLRWNGVTSRQAEVAAR